MWRLVLGELAAAFSFTPVPVIFWMSSTAPFPAMWLMVWVGFTSLVRTPIRQPAGLSSTALSQITRQRLWAEFELGSMEFIWISSAARSPTTRQEMVELVEA